MEMLLHLKYWKTISLLFQGNDFTCLFETQKSKKDNGEISNRQLKFGLG